MRPTLADLAAAVAEHDVTVSLAAGLTYSITGGTWQGRRAVARLIASSDPDAQVYGLRTPTAQVHIPRQQRSR